MKTPLIIAFSGIAFGALGFIIGDRNDDSAPTEESSSTAVRPTVRKTISQKTNSSSAARGSVRPTGDSSRRSITGGISNILKLNAREIKDLLAGPDFQILDSTTQPLFSAAISRLTEIDPMMALETAKGLDTNRKRSAFYALFREWSAQDTDTVIAMAVDGKFGKNKTTALYRALSELSRQDPDRALELAQKHDITSAYSAIMTNMAKNDPQTALEKCSLLSSYAQKSNRAKIIQAWTLKDPQKAKAYIAGVENKNEKSQLLVGLIEATSTNKAFVLLEDNIDDIDLSHLEKLTAKLVKEKPSQMIEWLEKLPIGKNKSKLTAEAVEHWFKVDEAKAIAYCQSISNKQMHRAVSDNLLNSLSNSQPKKFLELYPTMGSQDTSDWNLRNALTQTAKTDTPYAMEYLNTLTDSKQRKQAIKSILEGVAQNNPDKALVEAAKLSDPNEKDIALASIYQRIADKDPEAVVKAFKERGMKNIGDFKVSDFVHTYARNDLEAAKSLVDSIEDPLIWDQSVSRLLYAWAEDDPHEAIEFALQQEQTSGIGQSLSQLSGSLAKADPQKALDIALAQPANSISKNMLSNVFRTWVNQDIEKAVEVLQQIPADRIDSYIYSTAASAYAQNDPAKGAQWVDSLQDEKAKEQAASSLVSSWLRKDPDSAVSWVETMQSGSSRDNAVSRVVSTFSGSDPIYAIEWANTLSNESSSKSLMRRTYGSWKGRDSKAANKWLNSTNLVNNEDRENWQK